MLVLTRKKGQKILIGEDIVITVLTGGHVRIGIDAPMDLPIVRGEIKISEEENNEIKPSIGG